MDISNITPNTIEFQLRHPGNRQGLDIYFTVRSNQSDEVKAATEAYLEKSRAAERRGNPLTVAEVKEESIGLTLAAVVKVRFEGKASWKGETKSTPELMRDMMSTDWIRGQVDRQVQADADFFKG